jgi:hypothetical protein
LSEVASRDEDGDGIRVSFMVASLTTTNVEQEMEGSVAMLDFPPLHRRGAVHAPRDNAKLVRFGSVRFGCSVVRVVRFLDSLFWSRAVDGPDWPNEV